MPAVWGSYTCGSELRFILQTVFIVVWKLGSSLNLWALIFTANIHFLIVTQSMKSVNTVRELCVRGGGFLHWEWLRQYYSSDKHHVLVKSFPSHKQRCAHCCYNTENPKPCRVFFFLFAFFLKFFRMCTNTGRTSLASNRKPFLRFKKSRDAKNNGKASENHFSKWTNDVRDAT